MPLAPPQVGLFKCDSERSVSVRTRRLKCDVVKCENGAFIRHILTSLDMPADNVTSSNTIALSVSLAPEEDWSRAE